MLSLDFVNEWWVGTLSRTKTHSDYYESLKELMDSKIKGPGAADRVPSSKK